jgi:hypothetical protein
MAEGAVIHIARERDLALGQVKVLAAETRAHEQAVRDNLASPWRPADERLYRRLRQVNGAGSNRKGRGPWA